MNEYTPAQVIAIALDQAEQDAHIAKKNATQKCKVLIRHLTTWLENAESDVAGSLHVGCASEIVQIISDWDKHIQAAAMARFLKKHQTEPRQEEGAQFFRIRFTDDDNRRQEAWALKVGFKGDLDLFNLLEENGSFISAMDHIAPADAQAYPAVMNNKTGLLEVVFPLPADIDPSH